MCWRPSYQPALSGRVPKWWGRGSPRSFPGAHCHVKLIDPHPCQTILIKSCSFLWAPLDVEVGTGNGENQDVAVLGALVLGPFREYFLGALWTLLPLASCQWQLSCPRPRRYLREPTLPAMPMLRPQAEGPFSASPPAGNLMYEECPLAARRCWLAVFSLLGGGGQLEVWL